ncbi:MAG: tyrosine--tRNA ligase [Cytophagales bacterium]|nr:MAG: tyrosine--tRNA ligase [Cytophagales bacterium]
MTFIEQLRWRGMVHDIMPGTEQLLEKEMVTAYVGVDPTADSMHVGHLVSVMMLKHLQIAGHKPILVVGGATGMIGDPSGKSAERNLLSEEILNHNVESLKTQMRKFLDFSSGGNSAELLNNYDWMKDFSFLHFLRDVGKHLTVSYMMSKDSVQNRLETGLSFTEFSYQLLQGYDFYWLHTNKNCKLQLGGSDQWGNIVTGTELIRRKSGGEAFALTCPLMTKSDGGKFGKTESGAIWLNPTKTSPYSFYQFWLNAADADASKWIKIFTLKSKQEIETLENLHAEAPHLRILQKALAEEITTRVHSQIDLDNAIEASEILFGKGTTETLQKLDELTFLSVFEGVTQISVTKSDLLSCLNVIDFLSIDTQNLIFPSKGEARKMIDGGGVSINKIKIDNQSKITDFDFIQQKYLLVQKGKKNYNIIHITN